MQMWSGLLGVARIANGSDELSCFNLVALFHHLCVQMGVIHLPAIVELKPYLAAAGPAFFYLFYGTVRHGQYGRAPVGPDIDTFVAAFSTLAWVTEI